MNIPFPYPNLAARRVATEGNEVAAGSVFGLFRALPLDLSWHGEDQTEEQLQELEAFKRLVHRGLVVVDGVVAHHPHVVGPIGQCAGNHSLFLQVLDALVGVAALSAEGLERLFQSRAARAHDAHGGLSILHPALGILHRRLHGIRPIRLDGWGGGGRVSGDDLERAVSKEPIAPNPGVGGDLFHHWRRGQERDERRLTAKGANCQSPTLRFWGQRRSQNIGSAWSWRRTSGRTLPNHNPGMLELEISCISTISTSLASAEQ